MLVFRNIKGYPPGYRVAVNVRSSKVFDGGEVGLEKVQMYRKHRRKKTEPIPPRVVEEGPALENVQEGDAINALRVPGAEMARRRRRPLHRHRMPGDHQGPDSDWVNLGTYRVQVHDKNTLRGVHRARQARRRHPPQILGARASIARWWSPSASRRCWARWGRRRPGRRSAEYDIAGSRLGRPIDVIRGRHTGIPFPADAEIVFEGFMPPPEEVPVPEGPFGEWPGYYASSTRPEPVLQVKARLSPQRSDHRRARRR